MFLLPYTFGSLAPQFSADRGILSRAMEFAICRRLSAFLLNYTEFGIINRSAFYQARQQARLGICTVITLR